MSDTLSARETSSCLRASQAAIGEQLRAVYDAWASDDLPPHLAELVEALSRRADDEG